MNDPRRVISYGSVILVSVDGVVDFLRPGSSVAICDVDEQRLQQAAERVGGNPKLFRDYRELLEQKDIDAVFITTPDHWHALMTVHACQAGKDVYVEKPACNTIEEGRAMVEAKNRYGRIVQVGSQGRSQDGAYHGKKYIVNGQIGDVETDYLLALPESGRRFHPQSGTTGTVGL